MSPIWPQGTVRALLATDHVTRPTRAALEARLAVPPVMVPRALDGPSLATLRAACARLIPQDGPDRVDIAGTLDARLADDARDGWRYDAMPSDRDAMLLGLTGLDETGQVLFGDVFAHLAPPGQDAVLAAVRAGSAPGAVWTRLPARLWFEELLAEVAEIWMAHPIGQEAVGYVGFADAHGWRRIGLDEHEAIEPAPVGPAPGADLAP